MVSSVCGRRWRGTCLEARAEGELTAFVTSAVFGDSSRCGLGLGGHGGGDFVQIVEERMWKR